MRQLYKQTGTVLGIAAVFYCLYFQVTMQSFAQTKPANADPGVVKTKAQKKVNEKVAAKLKGDKKAQTKGTLPDTHKASAQSERPLWWPSCTKAAVLVATGKAAEGEKILAVLVPQAKEQIPNSLDLGITLARYGIALLANQKYDLAVTTFAEAAKIIHDKPPTERQQTAMFQTLGDEGAALLRLQKFDQAEPPIRKAIAYGIAYPAILKHGNLKKCYVLLRRSLDGQNKPDEASVVAEIVEGF